MSKITGTGAGIKFLISAFNMVKRGEIKSLDELLQFAKQEFGEIDLGFIDQIKDTFKKGQASAVTEKRTKDIMKGDVVEEKGLSSLMKELEEKAENLKKTLDESKKSTLTTLEDALDAATGFRRSMGSKDKTKPFRTPDMPYQKENPNYRLPGGSMYAEGNLRTAIRQFLKSEIEAGNLKVNETDAFRVKEYSPMMEDDPIDVFRRYYGEDALQAADDMADALKEGTSFKNYEEIFRRDMPEIKVKLEGAGEYDSIIKETQEILKKAQDDADYAKTLDEFDVIDRKKNSMGGMNRLGYADGNDDPKKLIKKIPKVGKIVSGLESLKGAIGKVMTKFGEDAITTGDKAPTPSKTLERDMFKKAEERFNKTDSDIYEDNLKNLGDLGAPKLAERFRLKRKYPGITDDLLDKILVDDNMQRKAEVLATIDEAFKMMEKGKGTDEILDTMKNVTRTKNSEGGFNTIALDKEFTKVFEDASSKKLAARDEKQATREKRYRELIASNKFPELNNFFREKIIPRVQANIGGAFTTGQRQQRANQSYQDYLARQQTSGTAFRPGPGNNPVVNFPTFNPPTTTPTPPTTTPAPPSSGGGGGNTGGGGSRPPSYTPPNTGGGGSGGGNTFYGKGNTGYRGPKRYFTPGGGSSGGGSSGGGKTKAGFDFIKKDGDEEIFADKTPGEYYKTFMENYYTNRNPLDELYGAISPNQILTYEQQDKARELGVFDDMWDAYTNKYEPMYQKAYRERDDLLGLSADAYGQRFYGSQKGATADDMAMYDQYGDIQNLNPEFYNEDGSLKMVQNPQSGVLPGFTRLDNPNSVPGNYDEFIYKGPDGNIYGPETYSRMAASGSYKDLYKDYYDSNESAIRSDFITAREAAGLEEGKRDEKDFLGAVEYLGYEDDELDKLRNPFESFEDKEADYKKKIEEFESSEDFRNPDDAILDAIAKQKGLEGPDAKENAKEEYIRRLGEDYGIKKPEEDTRQNLMPGGGDMSTTTLQQVYNNPYVQEAKKSLGFDNITERSSTKQKRGFLKSISDLASKFRLPLTAVAFAIGGPQGAQMANKVLGANEMIRKAPKVIDSLKTFAPGDEKPDYSGLIEGVTGKDLSDLTYGLPQPGASKVDNNNLIYGQPDVNTNVAYNKGGRVKLYNGGIPGFTEAEIAQRRNQQLRDSRERNRTSYSPVPSPIAPGGIPGGKPISGNPNGIGIFDPPSLNREPQPIDQMPMLPGEEAQPIDQMPMLPPDRPPAESPFPGTGAYTPPGGGRETEDIMSGYDDFISETYGDGPFMSTADVRSYRLPDGTIQQGSSTSMSRLNAYLKSIGQPPVTDVPMDQMPTESPFPGTGAYTPPGSNNLEGVPMPLGMPGEMTDPVTGQPQDPMLARYGVAMSDFDKMTMDQQDDLHEAVRYTEQYGREPNTQAMILKERGIDPSQFRKPDGSYDRLALTQKTLESGITDLFTKSADPVNRADPEMAEYFKIADAKKDLIPEDLRQKFMPTGNESFRELQELEKKAYAAMSEWESSMEQQYSNTPGHPFYDPPYREKQYGVIGDPTYTPGEQVKREIERQDSNLNPYDLSQAPQGTFASGGRAGFKFGTMLETSNPNFGRQKKDKSHEFLLKLLKNKQAKQLNNSLKKMVSKSRQIKDKSPEQIAKAMKKLQQLKSFYGKG